MNKFRTAILAGLAALVVGAGAALASIQLGGSIFPLTFITTPPWNITDAFNQMESLINQQVMPSGIIIAPPGGRLSLNSTVPVPIADVALTSNIWYIPYITENMPVYNGTAGNPWQQMDIGASGLTMQLSSSATVAELYDIYGFNNNGQPAICAMAWGSGNTRSTSAGGGTNGTGGSQNTAIQQVNGLWTNKAAIATGNCFGGSTGVTPVSYALNSNAGTLLGTIYTISTGNTEVNCVEAGVSQGLVSAGVYLSNAYNRVPIACVNKDSNLARTNATAAWVELGSSDSIFWVDSLAQEAISYIASVVAGNATGGDCASFGVALSSGGTPKTVASACNPGTGGLASSYQTLTVSDSFYPILGLSSAVAETLASAGTATYMPMASQMENFQLNLSY